MARLQHYNGRLYEVDEVFQVLAYLYGKIASAEQDQPMSTWRYKKWWKVRTLIACLRDERGVSSTGGLGYGPDWKGVMLFDPYRRFERLHAPRMGVSLKSKVIEYSKKNRVPLDALRLAVGVIRRRDEEAWVQHSLRAQALRSATSFLEAAE